MSTQVQSAKNGQVTKEMRVVARDEKESPTKIRQLLSHGRIVIARNVQRKRVHPLGIGEGLRIKVNANVGTSPDLCDLELEVKKAKMAIQHGADTVMDLSTGGDLDEIRRAILNAVEVPVGTVPIYQSAIEAAKRKGSIVNMTEDDIFNTIERHAKDGVDFMTLHCGVTRRVVQEISKHPRLMGIVSRGGTFLTAWILHNDRDNPLYANYGYLLEIAEKYDFTLSLGDGLRPGCIFDATDWLQVQELATIGELIERARDANVQAIVEGIYRSTR